jgi:hypothetical protein
MPAPDLDDIRQSVLDRMERGERLVKWSIIGAAAVEALLLVVAILLVDWHDRLHKLLFMFFVLSYSIVALGLLALAGHISRGFGNLLAAIESGSGRSDAPR